MDTDSLVQPNRRLRFFETAEELPGHLRVPERPEATSGYANIYRGVWTNPQGREVEVAIKEFNPVILTDKRTDSKELENKRDMRIKQEAYVWSQVKHPNLHPLLGYRLESQPRLIGPWCRHGNLAEYIENNPGLSRLDKLRLIFQTACGLEHLHAQDPPICHADVKPENVLINDRLHAALSDFGLSRVVDLSGFTTSDSAKGTRNYMAPELFTEDKPRPTPMIDVYAFGGLVLAVMSGMPPFSGLNHPRIMTRVTNDQPPNPTEHLKLPPSDPLWSLMRRCWAKTPTARPRMGEILKELWGDICKEEFNFWSRLGLASVFSDDDPKSSGLDLDASEMPIDEIVALLNTGPALVSDSLPSIDISEETLNGVSEEAFVAAGKLLETLEVDSKIIPVIGRYVAAAADVGSILLGLSRIMDRNQGMATRLGFNALKLVDRLEQLREGWSKGERQELTSRVSDVQKELHCLQGDIEEWYSSGVFYYAFSCCDHADGRRDFDGSVKRALEEIRPLLVSSTTQLALEIKMQEQHRRLLNRLGDGNYAGQGNAIEDVICTPGTRVHILEQIDDWIRESSASGRTLWIRGMAGRGKSTIASTVAHHWKFRASCAIFHFRRGQDSLNRRLVCALAKQLGNSLVSDVKNSILESLRENEDIANEQLSEQFKTLLVAPWRKLGDHSFPILIIVDALDECHNAKDVVDFVRLIGQHSSSLPGNVKFLLTCRPEAVLLRAFEPRGWTVIDLDSAPEVREDITRFIRNACTQIRNEHHLAGNWPSSEDLSRLVDMSQGLFQWARTVITYISDRSPGDRLRGLLRPQGTWSGLDDLYHQILSKALDNLRQEPQKQQLLCSILGMLVVAPYPVSLEVVATLYRDREIFQGMENEGIIQLLRIDVLVDLNSLLHIPASTTESVQFMHTSVRDLLISEQRCRGEPYHIHMMQYHQCLAGLSVGLMLRLLKENICNLSDLSQASSDIQDVVGREVSQTLRYCCQAWSIHLTEGLPSLDGNNTATKNQLADFERLSKERILNWLEVMSLIQATSEAFRMARQLHHWLLVSLYTPRETLLSPSATLNRCPKRATTTEFELTWLARLWNDVYRFIAAFLEPISFGPLHIYASALPHCPLNTELWRRYGSRATVRVLWGPQKSTWSSNLWTKSIAGVLLDLAFVDQNASDNTGSLVRSVSSRQMIQFWDTETGTQMTQLPVLLEINFVSCACVSPDGKVLASGYDMESIQLWDLQTGLRLDNLLTGHRGDIRFLCFSPDGRRLALGSDGGTVQLWDSQTRRQVGEQSPGHKAEVCSVCFSPDGGTLASGSDDNTIILWDLRTRRQLNKPLTGHSAEVWAVCFSPDGRALASASKDNTIRLWNPQTREQLGEPLTGSRGALTSICFSPDNKVLASGSQEDGAIQLWDLQTRRQLGHPLEAESVSSLHFSPDGRVLSSASKFGTVKLWDPQTGNQLGEPLLAHDDKQRCLCFSPDGRLLASAYHNSPIQVWDLQTGSQVRELLTGRDCFASPLCFSPNGKLLAYGSRACGIEVWDIESGNQLSKSLNNHREPVTSVCFSLDGRYLASGSAAWDIRLWDPQTGRELGQMHPNEVQNVCFSPDSKLLASGFEDGYIQLWDSQTGKQFTKLLHYDEKRDGEKRVSALCFSQDRRLLASGSYKSPIRLWETQTGRLLSEIPIDDKTNVASIGFSSDGKILASGSDTGIIQLWDPQTGSQLGPSLIGHLNYVSYIRFSPDSRLLASGAEDGTIRLWDLQSVSEAGEPFTSHTNSHSPDARPYASGSSGETMPLSGVRVPSEPLDYGLSPRSLCISPDRRLLASGHGLFSARIELFDLQTGSRWGQRIGGFEDEARTVCFSPDGRVLASVSDNHVIRLWDPQTGEQLGKLRAGVSDESFMHICFSPDSRVLASGCDTGTIQLWDVQTMRQLGQLRNAGSVSSLCFSPDGRLLASGSGSGPCPFRLWDSHTYLELGEQMTNDNHPYFSPEVLSFSPDARFVIGATHKDKCIIWDTHLHQLEECSTPPPFPNRVRFQRPSRWLSRSFSRFLWLPSEYWDPCMDDKITIQNDMLAISHDGFISVFDLTPLG